MTASRSWEVFLWVVIRLNFPQLDRPLCKAITINEPNFRAEYDQNRGIWVVSWKWSSDEPPATIKNRLAEYPALKQLWEKYDHKLQTWIDNSWLLPYPEDELRPQSLIPLQENKQKVRLEFCELNEPRDTYTARADVCSEWWQQGSNDVLLDCARHTSRSTLTSLCGYSKQWKLRDKDIASPAWNLG